MQQERQKVGLALSGGGFRASFFHIGVLARLAETGLLRRAEVISAVSGGSIIAALYYVHVKALLEEKSDDEIDDDKYVAIVQKIEVDFLRAVEKNFRMRAFRNPLKNLRMMRANYSRSDRLGELYDELLYRRVLTPAGKRLIEMRELHIHPADGPADFHPRRDNDARKAKVPILVLNATALNNGHNWRFEASRMGEPERDSDVARAVDGGMRLRRPPSYANMTKRQQNIELGLAVAASAGVPGIFAPLAISGLYDREIRVQLVDGGVHDNQGIQALLDERCSHFIVSDASGQLPDQTEPATGGLSVMLRSNDVLMDRIREEELFALLTATRGRTAFMHLRTGIPAEVIGWLDQNDRPAPPDAPLPVERTSHAFGVDPEVQKRLSRIRTDLDSFTEIEAKSLMLDAYAMSQPELDAVFNAPARAEVAWGFLDIRPWMRCPTPEYLKHLDVAQQRAFKVFRLSWVVMGASAALAIVLAWGAWTMWPDGAEDIARFWNGSIPIRWFVITAVSLALGLVPAASRSFKILRLLRRPSEAVLRAVVRGLSPACGALFVNIHLWIFDRIFLRLGRVNRLRPPESTGVPLAAEESAAPDRAAASPRPIAADRT